jgi:hypothetical protein
MKTIDTNRVVAIAALITSVVAVFIAWDESRLLRKSQAASFMPIVETRPTFNLSTDNLLVAIAIRNSGHGVAYVEAAELVYDGEPVTSYEAFFETVLRPDLREEADFSWASMHGFLQPGETKPVISLRWPDNARNREKLSQFLNEEIAAKTEKVRLEICYCSVFGDCWMQSQLGSARPEPRRACESGGEDPSERLWQTRYASAEQ